MCVRYKTELALRHAGRRCDEELDAVQGALEALGEFADVGVLT